MKSITFICEQHVRNRKDDGTQASVWCIRDYLGYEEDEQVCHYSEHPDIECLVTRISYKQATELMKNLEQLFTGIGFNVECHDCVDD